MSYSNRQLYLLTLNENERLKSSIFRLEKGWVLHFILGPSLSTKDVRLFVNHPVDSKSGPNREIFRQLSWQNDSNKFDIFDKFAEVHLVLAGAFDYYFTIDGSCSSNSSSGSGCFLVDPILTTGPDNERIPLDCLSSQTYLAKSLGPFSEWRSRLLVTEKCEYRMVHITPIQVLGGSNSAYCIKDQLEIDPRIAGGETCSLSDVTKLVRELREAGILVITDLVYNHTANESTWILEHPECAYNLINSPHLRPAYLLDRLLWSFSFEVSRNEWKHEGITPIISSQKHVDSIKKVLQEKVDKLKFDEFFLIDIENEINKFKKAIKDGVQVKSPVEENLFIIQDPEYRRLKSVVDLNTALHLHNIERKQANSEEQRIEWSCDGFRYHLEQLNSVKKTEVRKHLDAAISNVILNIMWHFINPDGPKNPNVSSKFPLCWNYFIIPPNGDKFDLVSEQEIMYSEKAAFCMAHNGWVMDHDPLINFAEPGSNVYLRRELIPWGDSVKLRYGDSPGDCPFLWNHMKEYTLKMAHTFHGVRLDNCHSTPLKVAGFMLDEARKINPDLYVVAELFTNNEATDNEFINTLGINSLIREALNAGNAQHLGQMIHQYGGLPVGAFFQLPARPLTRSRAHAILYDQTHDNPSPIEKRSVYDLFPSAALVSMSCCATGSNRGYDEIVPHHIHVVEENRLYHSWTDNSGKQQSAGVGQKTGMIYARKILNRLHTQLSQKGFTQIYVDQINRDVVSVTRHNPNNHQSIILVAHTAFKNVEFLDESILPPFKIPGCINEVLFEGCIMLDESSSKPFVRNPDAINGLQGYLLELRENIDVAQSHMIKRVVIDDSTNDEIQFINFPPGSVIALRVSLKSHINSAIIKIRSDLSQFGYKSRTLSGRDFHAFLNDNKSLETIISKLNFNDINRVLYRCDREEQDDGLGFGAYDIPGYGPMVYCGLQGVMSILSSIRSSNDLGHPLCENLRQGDWLLDYTASRLLAHPQTEELGKWFSDQFNQLKMIPRYLIPCYFDAIITGVFTLVIEYAWSKMPRFISEGSSFVRYLALGSYQFCSSVRSAELPPLSKNLSKLTTSRSLNEDQDKSNDSITSIAAGLPHFAGGIFRCWGRDTFIALRGLLLLTGRYSEARDIILSFAGTLRHGLIPNLLGAGVSARYNCRDAVWWWLECVQQYVTLVPNGVTLLSDPVCRMYPTDDCEPQFSQTDQPLYDTIQEALQRHANGIKYRERNAGTDIDQEMSEVGFDVEVGVDWNTGFVQGGSIHNCGTWMDKMGSSKITGNAGKPATPRDGSAVELVGLSKSAVRWLSKMNADKKYPYDGVTVSGERVTYAEWDAKIQSNFEEYFYINTQPDLDPESERHKSLIHHRGIYKDSYGASQEWADYQFRPNFTIAMVVAPELFTWDHAWYALDMVSTHLSSPLGLKTLDPDDWAYNGNYVNNDDSRGWNYHQGPEWLWPVGFFLRAKLIFAKSVQDSQPNLIKQTKDYINLKLSFHNVYIQTSDWRSLPELTNKNGTKCADSCFAQAWSVGAILEVLYDLEDQKIKNDASLIHSNNS